MKRHNGDCLQVLLFGTFAESRYYLGEFKYLFDLVGFNANMIAHAPDGVSAFVAQLANKAFFIDPQTHAFQQPLKTVMRKNDDGDWELKPSIRKLACEYGSFVSKAAGVSRIGPGLSEGELKEITEGCLSFQWNKLQSSLEQSDAKEFLGDVHLRPEFLVAPYFYLEPDEFNEELKDNLRFVEQARAVLTKIVDKESVPLYAELVVGKELLIDNSKYKKITDDYKDSAADGFLLWIDNFSEVIESKDSLKKYLSLLTNLRSTEKPIIALHGSYLSVALSGPGFSSLAGVGHGIEYGESRSVIPIGGGVPLAKFYFSKFFKRVNYDPDALDVLLEMNWIADRKTFLREVCSCVICKDTIGEDVVNSFHKYGETRVSAKNNKAYPTREAMHLSRTHYMHRKRAEHEFCKTASTKVIIDELSNSASVSAGIKSQSFDHLKKWADVLTIVK